VQIFRFIIFWENHSALYRDYSILLRIRSENIKDTNPELAESLTRKAIEYENKARGDGGQEAVGLSSFKCEQFKAALYADESSDSEVCVVRRKW